ncbi:adult-specific rigid cuticular protein 15.7-like [Centruroides sculpturatus]|uniref:adult-specific rigid cuticular protein 15.7-like n=1 Tax=Centruroides sculpturatus TaxID=218467 RepID=UPI000C6C9D7B|nr:adult-specific rigid cuticular protein 15.7-like [Centruroides sculpturatus]
MNMLPLFFVLMVVGCQAGYQTGGYNPGGAGYNPAYYGAAAVARPYYSGPIDESPKPYDFSYVAPAIGGQSTRKETGDGSGRVVGSYTLNDDDGRSRVVEYVADAGGFRASVKTNEPGTRSDSPADVDFQSTALDPFKPGFPFGRGAGGRYAGQPSHAYPHYGRVGAATGAAGYAPDAYHAAASGYSNSIHHGAGKYGRAW